MGSTMSTPGTRRGTLAGTMAPGPLSPTHHAPDGADWRGLLRLAGATGAARMGAALPRHCALCACGGGVLEHPAYSDAWAAFDLPRPRRQGGWQRGLCGGWSCHVEQGRYGHDAKKATWLYAYGVTLPDLKWGSDPDVKSRALVSWCGNRIASGESRPRLGKQRASATPPEFRDILIAMARSAQNQSPR